jgi:sarcosine oxidase
VPERWDVIVTGLGAMGSAAVRELARRGLRVLGLDRYAPPHAHGSTHGRTRITREAYFEHPAYVPLVQRATALWTALEREAGARLLTRTGGLMIGPEDGILVRGARASAEEHRLPYEMLTPAELSHRFPGLVPEPNAVGLYEPNAGVLFPEECVRTLLACATRDGAALRTGEPMLTWRAEGGVVRVATAMGEHVADRLVLTLGPWLPDLLGGAALRLTVARQVQYWFVPRRHAERFAADRLPIALWETSGHMFYTIPDFGDGLKFAVHHEGDVTDPQRVRRTVSGDEDASARALVERFLPDAAGDLRERAVCLYTNADDGHFVIDHHPVHREVLVVSPCSGHGFKFATAIAEIVAQMITGERGENLSLFRFR